VKNNITPLRIFIIILFTVSTTINAAGAYKADQVASFSDAQTIHYQNLVRVRFQIPSGWEKSKPLVSFIPKKQKSEDKFQK